MNGSTAQLLDRFYAASPRHSMALGGRDGIRGHVDALLNHLRVPAVVDPDGDWVIDNDAGQFTLFVRDTDQRVIVRQRVVTLDGDLGDYADDLGLLMLLNRECEGACFASQRAADGDGLMVVLTGQVPWKGLDAERLARLLAAAFGLAAELDEALRGEEPEAEAEAEAEAGLDAEPEPVAVTSAEANGNGSWPANWYDDPRGEARLRYWDGSAWTDHTAV